MKNRKHLGKNYSKKLFSNTARKVHPKNGLNSVVMRGGIRL